MNKTVTFIAFVILTAIALAGEVLVLLFVPERFATFTQNIIVLLGLASAFAITVNSLTKQKQEITSLKEDTNTKLDVVQRQTNGTLTTLINRNHELSDQSRHKDEEIAALKARLMHDPVPAKGK